VTADQILILLFGVRPRGKNQWTAQCPAHNDRSPSLTIRETHDRILIRCWASCAVADVCAAIGMTLADLYHDRRAKPDPVVLRRRRAADGLESWRHSEMRRCAEGLRTRDIIIRQIDLAVHDCVLTEDEALTSLEHEYHGYTALEDRFDRLLRNQDTLQLWRESRT